MKITFIIGGAKSGKSSFALNEASKIAGQKAYIATAEALDDEMSTRIENHKLERGSEWDTYEEPLNVDDVLKLIDGKYGAAVLDCLTIWLSNLIVRSDINDIEHKTVIEAIEVLTDRLKNIDDMQLFIVSNEVGTGIVPENRLARQFRDLAGRLNQKVAEIADNVYLVAAGIPIKIKQG